MPSRARKLLQDIRVAAGAIVEFISGRTVADYESDRMLRSAVERQFEIIGEATTRLKREAPDVAAALSNTDQIIGFRNIIAHGYDEIRNDVVWETATLSLPQLIAEVDALMAKTHD